MSPRVAIIIRSKNEERWIGRCLKMVFAQEFTDFEVLLVDNMSTDHTRDIAAKFPVKILEIEHFRPGLAINMGVRACSADFLVCLSAHCIPRDEKWLGALVDNMRDSSIAGVYGRQLPFAYSKAMDKRDLLITFGLDRRVQEKDSFFHNANSLFRRSVWNEIPFDETMTNIEDRAWGKQVIAAGYRIAYEPEAAVYHHHGIHQDRNAARATSIVRIMEELDGAAAESIPRGFLPGTMSTLAILPVRGMPARIGGVDLLSRCVSQIKQSSFIRDVIAVADGEAAVDALEASGARAIVRPAALAAPEATVEDVLQHALAVCEKGSDAYDAVVYVNYLYPFRPAGFFDRLIEEFAYSGADSVVPTLKDYQAYWTERDGKMTRVDAGFLPRETKPAVQKGMVGLGSISSAEFVRGGALLGEEVMLVPFDEQLYSVKAGDDFSDSVIEMYLAREGR